VSAIETCRCSLAATPQLFLMKLRLATAGRGCQLRVSVAA
jgi:hypothetical protein